MTPRVLIDANVLFPTILREIVLGTAAAGHFEPLWSARILEEWARATRRLPPGAEPLARAAAQAMRARWPHAEVPADPDLEAALSLPDPADRHVLGAAIAGGADLVLTQNLGFKKIKNKQEATQKRLNLNRDQSQKTYGSRKSSKAKLDPSPQGRKRKLGDRKDSAQDERKNTVTFLLKN